MLILGGVLKQTIMTARRKLDMANPQTPCNRDASSKTKRQMLEDMSTLDKSGGFLPANEGMRYPR